MSTEFAFWRTAKKLEAKKIYLGLASGKRIRGLDVLDLDRAEAALIGAFPSWTIETRRSATSAQTALSAPDASGGLDIAYTPQSVIVTCYGTGPDEWNRVIDAMLSLDLPLYDPQIDERFAS